MSAPPNDSAERAALRLGLPAVLALLLAVGLFEVFGQGMAELVERLRPHLVGPDADSVQLSLNELRLRLLSLATFLAFVVGAGCFVAVSARLLRDNLPRERRARYLAVGGLVSLVCTLPWILHRLGVDSPSAALAGFPHACLEASGRLQPHELRVTHLLIDAYYLVVALLPLTAIGALTSTVVPRGDDPRARLEHWTRQLDHVRRLSLWASLLLIVGVQSIVVWTRYPSALIADPATARAVADYATALGLYWGLAYSILLGLLALPARLYLRERARELLAGPLEQGERVEEELTTRGFALAPRELARQSLIVLGPLLSGPVVSGLVEASGTLS